MSEEFKKENLSTDNYSCPNCGGKMTFDPKAQMLKCPYCFSQMSVTSGETDKVEEQDLHFLLKETKVWDNTEVVQCQNCGSKEVLGKGQIATSCAFCGTTNIVKTSEIVGMKPHGVCPFEITDKDASARAKQWARKNWLAPNSFKKSAEAKEIKGIYTPAFTFDCDSNTTYKGVLVKTYKNSKGETYKKFIDIAGKHDQKFDDLIIQASSSIPVATLNKLTPFPTNACLPYDQKYLAGFTANTYSKDGQQAWSDCKKSMDNIIKKNILRGYSYDYVDRFNAETSYTNAKFKYVLLPMYVGHHKFKGKNYNFYVNGATGKVAGKAPISFWKALFLGLGIAGFVALVVFLALMGR